MRKITEIIIHCSDSTFGDEPQIKSWHTMPPPRGRGWTDIGYHYVITNGQITPKIPYQEGMDGIIQKGRPVEEAGSHCKGHNANSIGVCLVGIKEFTAKQMEALYTFLLVTLLPTWGLRIDHVIGHYETDTGAAQGKTCPNMDMVKVRAELEKRQAPIVNGRTA